MEQQQLHIHECRWIIFLTKYCGLGSDYEMWMYTSFITKTIVRHKLLHFMPCSSVVTIHSVSMLISMIVRSALLDLLSVTDYRLALLQSKSYKSRAECQPQRDCWYVESVDQCALRPTWRELDRRSSVHRGLRQSTGKTSSCKTSQQWTLNILSTYVRTDVGGWLNAYCHGVLQEQQFLLHISMC